MMNRGHVLEMTSSPVQPTLANPSWWNNINGIRPAQPLPTITSPPPLPPQQHPTHQPSYYYEPTLGSHPSQFFPSFVPTWRGDINQEEEELPYDQSLSQLLLYGLAGDQDRKDNNLNNGAVHHGKPRLFDNWGYHQQYLRAPSPNASSSVTEAVKEEVVINSPASVNYHTSLFVHHSNEDFALENSAVSQSTNNSTSKSCVTSLGKKNPTDPVPGKKLANNGKRLGTDPFSEHKGSVSGGNSLKRVKSQSSSSSSSQTHQANIKVRKEKLGDRITTLHQLVSPFGKTDTASVLLEATAYVRFLQGQIEVLSSPYFGGGGPGDIMHQKMEFHGESKADLRSRGLCLVPISWTTQMGNDDINGADFWAPALGSPAGLFH